MSTLGPDASVVIVGAGLGAWRVAEGLRRNGFVGRIELVGAESHTPYDRPPLSKQILSGKWNAERAELASVERLAELDVTGHFGVPAVALDVARRSVQLASGDEISGTRVVLATGVRARTLALSAASRVHTIRTRDDVDALRLALNSLAAQSTVVIIGGGFIGAEAATSLAALGFRPVVIETLERPLYNVLGPHVSSWLEDLPANAGIELRHSQTVLDVVDNGDDLVVQLADGSSLSSPVVIVAVGAEPTTDWLASSGIELNAGVVVDDRLCAAEGIYALGDVARFTWRHGPFVDHVRIEHWQVANDHAQYLAAQFTDSDADDALSMVPYFWSDQYGKKIQMLGHPAPSDDVTHVAGSFAESKWLAMYSRAGIVTGLVALNQPRALMVSRDLVAEHATLVDAVERQPWA